MKCYLDKEEKVGGYKLAELKKDSIDEFYGEAAKMLNCKPDNIAFTYNATDSFTRALSSIPLQPGDLILTTDDDYISNHIAFISLKKRNGIRIKRMENTHSGDVDLDALEASIKKDRPAIVSVSHIPTNSGKVQDVASIGEICHKEEIYFIVDACQSVGQLPIDVHRIKCDFLSATGRKFLRGPRGTGLLYISDRVIDEKYAPLFLDMRGGDWIENEKYKLYPGARRYEYWEFNYANVLGLKEAIRYGNDLGWDRIRDYDQMLLESFRDSLRTVPGMKIYDEGQQLSNIITWQIKGMMLEETKAILDQNDVYYSIASIDSALIDFRKKGVEWAVRISPHYFNTVEEGLELAEILKSSI
jgi:selenocysteine lyase/cysteine desulfurase